MDGADRVGPAAPMETRLHFDISRQPDDTTCGPTCLHAIYDYYGDRRPLGRVIEEIPPLEYGGTLGVLLACHALRNGYRATIYTYNLQVFDPTWEDLGAREVRDKLVAQKQVKPDPKLRYASDAYIDFLALGGKLRFRDLSARLIREILASRRPILTGLSATYLYNSYRERAEDNQEDDLRGVPVGHFVVLCGYHRENRRVLVADPLHPNPVSKVKLYEVEMNRLLNSILLGIITYDANLLVIEPDDEEEEDGNDTGAAAGSRRPSAGTKDGKEN